MAQASSSMVLGQKEPLSARAHIDFAIVIPSVVYLEPGLATPTLSEGRQESIALERGDTAKHVGYGVRANGGQASLARVSQPGKGNGESWPIPMHSNYASQVAIPLGYLVALP